MWFSHVFYSQLLSTNQYIYNSALFAQSEPVSRTQRVVPTWWQNRLTLADVWDLWPSGISDDGTPICLQNQCKALVNSSCLYIGYTATKPLSLTKTWQHIFWRGDLAAGVANIVSVKKVDSIRRYLSILTFELSCQDIVLPALNKLNWVFWSIAPSTSFSVMHQSLDKTDVLTPWDLSAVAALIWDIISPTLSFDRMSDRDSSRLLIVVTRGPSN